MQSVTEMLADLPQAVRLVVMTTETCEYCEQIVQLAKEVADTSENVTVEIYALEDNQDKAEELNVTMGPVIAIIGEEDYGLRYYGIPSGHEFTTLLQGIIGASHGHAHDIDEYTQTFLKNLEQPVHIQVFVTPQCPYCPRSAVLAYNMAIASDKIRAEVIESVEFQELSEQYNVRGVPLNIINGTKRVEGAAPPQMMINAIEEALA